MMSQDLVHACMPVKSLCVLAAHVSFVGTTDEGAKDAAKKESFEKSMQSAPPQLSLRPTSQLNAPTEQRVRLGLTRCST